MKTAIILHGKLEREEYFDSNNPSPANSHWLPWLQKQLTISGILAETPEMPEPYEPDYEKWKTVFEGFSVDEETILVGHSCGAGFLVRWLSENRIKVGKVVLVAPWLDPNHDMAGDFFNFDIDEGLSDRTDGITIFYSTDDDQDVLESVEVLEKTVKNISIRKFENKGHFTIDDMGTEEFPELLEEVLK